jgi:hypothetical protein
VKIQANEEGAALAKEDLKEINRQIRAQKRFNLEVINGLMVRSAVKILEGINENNPKVWAGIYEGIAGYSEDRTENLKMIKSGSASIGDIKFYIAQVLAKSGCWAVDPKERLSQVNQTLVKLGMEPLDISYDGPEQSDQQKSENGKPLVEVWAEDCVSAETVEKDISL